MSTITTDQSKQVDLYRLFIENVKDYAIFLVDKNGYISSWNNGAQQIFGYKPSEIIGKHFSVLFVPEDLAKKLPQKELAIVKSKGRADDNNLLLRKDGTSFWANGISTAIFSKDKKIRTIVKIVHDITRERDLNLRKDEFISIASHELRTPITSIKAYNQILIKQLKGKISPNCFQYLTKLDAQVTRLTGLVNDLLDVSRLQKGEIKVIKHQVDMNQLVGSVVEDFNQTTRTHKIILKGHITKKIAVDRDRLTQVMANLLTNAIKYSPSGKKVIVSVKELEGAVQVSVKDFGLGIDKDEQRYVFDRFYRVKGKSANKIPGLGLGLFISNEIVKQHGGMMGVESRAGKGSRFYFNLPTSVQS